MKLNKGELANNGHIRLGKIRKIQWGSPIQIYSQKIYKNFKIHNKK